MFKIGDRVKHNRHNDCSESIGTITGISGSYGQSAYVVWDKDSKLQQKIKGFINRRGENTHSFNFLEKVEDYMQYDPSQQGDTEDDI